MLPRNHELMRQSSENLGYNRTERRQWDKSNPVLGFEAPDNEVHSHTYKKRYDEYLVKLQMNNQMSKMATKKDEKDEKLEKLEAGFCVYINGAHRKSEKQTLRHTVARPSDTSRKLTSLRTNNQKINQPISKSKRRTWANSSFTIKTADGYKIRINAPTNMLSTEQESATKEDDYKEAFGNGHNNQENIIEEEKSYDSNESDDEEEGEVINRKIVVELTPKDARVLRRSMSIFDGENLKKRLEIQLEEHLELKPEEKEKTGKEENDCNVKEGVVNNEAEDICDIIFSKVVNLKPEDRLSLIDFLAKIEDESSKKSYDEKRVCLE